jgi:hypothetical protein
MIQSTTSHSLSRSIATLRTVFIGSDWEERSGEILVDGVDHRLRHGLAQHRGQPQRPAARSASTSTWSVPAMSTGASGICQEEPTIRTRSAGGLLP